MHALATLHTKDEEALVVAAKAAARAAQVAVPAGRREIADENGQQTTMVACAATYLSEAKTGTRSSMSEAMCVKVMPGVLRSAWMERRSVSMSRRPPISSF